MLLSFDAKQKLKLSVKHNKGYLSKYLTIKQYNEHRTQDTNIDDITSDFIGYITNPLVPNNKVIYDYEFPEKKINEIYTYLKKLNYINIQAFSDALKNNTDTSTEIQSVNIDDFLTELSNKNIHFKEKKRSKIYRGGKRKTIKRKNYRKRKTLKLRH